MYGDMAVARARASALRADASDARARARTLRQQADAMQWKSAAADVLRARVLDAATVYAALATTLDNAAADLESHARAVDVVKGAIAKAERWVRDRLDDARTIVSNVVETTQEVAQSAVNGFMKVVRWVSDGVSDAVEVSVCFLFGRQISHAEVAKAKDVTATVPAAPVAGSKDWLDLESLFATKGW